MWLISNKTYDNSIVSCLTKSIHNGLHGKFTPEICINKNSLNNKSRLKPSQQQPCIKHAANIVSLDFTRTLSLCFYARAYIIFKGGNIKEAGSLYSIHAAINVEVGSFHKFSRKTCDSHIRLENVDV